MKLFKSRLRINFISCLLLMAFFSKLSFATQGQDILTDKSADEMAERYASADILVIVKPLTKRSYGKVEILYVIKGKADIGKYDCVAASTFLRLARGKGLWLAEGRNGHNPSVCSAGHLNEISMKPVQEALGIAVREKKMKFNKGYSLKRIKEIAGKSDYKPFKVEPAKGS